MNIVLRFDGTHIYQLSRDDTKITFGFNDLHCNGGVITECSRVILRRTSRKLTCRYFLPIARRKGRRFPSSCEKVKFFLSWNDLWIFHIRFSFGGRINLHILKINHDNYIQSQLDAIKMWIVFILKISCGSERASGEFTESKVLLDKYHRKHCLIQRKVKINPFEYSQGVSRDLLIPFQVLTEK